MLQVKIIKAPEAALEGEINCFLQRIGSDPGRKVSVQDIKFGNNDTTVMIIYNNVPATQAPTKT